jgi:hypothetical protein
MQSFVRVVFAALFASVVLASGSNAQAPCANCKPAAKTVVKTKYKYRTVQRVNNVTRYRTVNKTNNVYMVRNVQLTRVVRVTYVARVLGMRRVSATEYARLQRGSVACKLKKCRPSMRTAARVATVKSKGKVKAKPVAQRSAVIVRPPVIMARQDR